MLFGWCCSVVDVPMLRLETGGKRWKELTYEGIHSGWVAMLNRE